MKTLAVICALFIGTHAFFTAEQHDIANRLIQQCATEIGEEFREISAERFIEGNLGRRDDKFKCFVRCVLSKPGFIDAAGEVNKEILIEKLSKGNTREKAEMIAELCHKFDGTDACQKAFGLYECYQKNKSIL
ncbi:uncharacterized protein LOC129780631 [Toxorhynchites rutilus septentrionalis]|uniref:uncharacterized protein LOC129780631 n=1 Tax=Toxorhynchites rutilus septentrionalis TaxID=329112 RepID=UPI00247A4329|nr:uncharacterized protein LOC129780631 [Toxorhynchites rutilus septentrionalis]